jgi:phage gp29-like protein
MLTVPKVKRADRQTAAAMAEPIGEAGYGTVRSNWPAPVISSLTPDKLAVALRQAWDGDFEQLMIIATEMEMREPHYRAQIGIRKDIVEEIEAIIEAVDDSEEEGKIADAVRALVARPQFNTLVKDLMDGIAKGFAVSRIDWDPSSGQWIPEAYTWIDQRFFRFDRETGTKIGLRDASAPDGLPLEPNRFIVHEPRLISGLTFRSGLIWSACWLFMMKNFTWRDWMLFLETYGIPIRLGKYPSGTTDTEKSTLLRAVRNIAGDAAAIIPETMQLELLETKGAANPQAHEKLCRYVDEQLSKLIVGQTMSSDSGSSLAQAEVHERLRLTIGRKDAKALAATIQRDLIIPFVTLNFKARKAYPEFTLPVSDSEDTKLLIETTKTFVEMGGKVSMKKMRDRLGIDDPEDDEELLSVARNTNQQDKNGEPQKQALQAKEAQSAAGAGKIKSSATSAFNRYLTPKSGACACCANGVHDTGKPGFIALAASGADPAEMDDIDRLLVDAEAEWQEYVDPMLQPLRDALDAATSFDDLLARIEGLSGMIDAGQLQAMLAKLTLAARGLGDATDDHG